MKLYLKSYYNIYLAISICILSKLVFVNYIADVNLENEWRPLFNNLFNNNIFAYRSFDGKLIPTVYMPPLYAYYIYYIKLLIPANYDLVKSVIISQIFISGITIFFFYKINLFFISEKLSLLFTYLFIFFPIYIFSTLQISSISIQVFLNMIFLFMMLKFLREKIKYFHLIIFGFLSGLIILLRGEFILIFIISLFFMIIYKKLEIKKLSIIIFSTVLVLSPYLIRNYSIFNKVIITKSFGYNLWKGNNIDSTVEGAETNRAFEYNNLEKKINELPKDDLYDLNYDSLFLNEALDFINNDRYLFLKRFVKKLFSFIFFNLDSEYPNYYHFLNIVPIFILSILFIISLIFSYKKNSLIYNYLMLNLLITVFIFSIFFILPRYKLIIIPLQLIFVNIFLSEFLPLKIKKKLF